MQRVIVIEDEVGVREDVTDALKEAGYAVTTASNGRDGLAAILADPPDLVICDRMMPVMSGDDVLAAMRRERPDFAKLPFIFLTALTDARDRYGVGDLSPTIYLGKPIDHRDLLRLVRDILAVMPARS
ncbi:MAG: response regulator [Alphaproteobacteria bacterium]|nr:response regulator [Alphaproteobacteria bacterium]